MSIHTRFKFAFDRYYKGRLMAEGVTVFAKNTREALRQAQALTEPNERTETYYVLRTSTLVDNDGDQLPTPLTGQSNDQAKRFADMLMANLSEEASEVIQSAMKYSRFGWNNSNLRDDPQNFMDLGREIGNLLYIIDLLKENGYILSQDIDDGYDEKAINIQKYGLFQ